MDINNCRRYIDIFIEVILTSDESESSSDDELGVRINKTRIENYIPNVVDNFTDKEFRENFRMSRRTFTHILSIIKDSISTSEVDKGHPTHDAKTQLLVAIWYFATPDSYRSICSRFNIGNATGLRIVRRVTNALIKLSPSVISWPKDEYMQTVVNGFALMGFPNVIGCVDGSYIPIPLPKDNGISYICRKNFASIILQGTCDHRLLFTHCYAGEVGSLHDANVLRRSEVWTYLNERTEQMFPNDVHLLGDKAYPCTPQLITPYKNNGNLTAFQRRFNYLHSAARSTIERAFGLLKKRWRILKFMDVRCVKWVPKYTIACCILHNICILQEDIMEIEIIEDDNEPEAIEVENENNAERRQRGQAKRNRLCNELNL